MKQRRSLTLLFGMLGLFAITACSTADDTARVDPIGPSKQNFDAVVGALDYRCGSLDCHGSMYRNMRIYGYQSLRLDPNTLPDSPTTTQAEVDATYDSIIGLEPEIMRQVVRDKGAKSSRLTFVRKGRGAENHKGGQRIVPGDAADTCVQSWLKGAVDVTACNKVSQEF